MGGKYEGDLSLVGRARAVEVGRRLEGLRMPAVPHADLGGIRRLQGDGREAQCGPHTLEVRWKAGGERKMRAGAGRINPKSGARLPERASKLTGLADCMQRTARAALPARAAWPAMRVNERNADMDEKHTPGELRKCGSAESG